MTTGRFLVLSLALWSVNCVGAYRANREQFKDRMKAGRFGGVEQRSVDKDLDQVVALLERKSTECFDGWVDYSGSGTIRTSTGQMEAHTYRQRYNTTIERKDGGLVEYSIRIQERPHGVGVPADGYYMFAVDLIHKEPGKTSATLFLATNAFKSTAAAIRQWTEGRDVPCPDRSRVY